MAGREEDLLDICSERIVSPEADGWTKSLHGLDSIDDDRCLYAGLGGFKGGGMKVVEMFFERAIGEAKSTNQAT